MSGPQTEVGCVDQWGDGPLLPTEMLDKPGHLPGTVNGFSNTRVAVPESAAPSPDHAAEHRVHPARRSGLHLIHGVDQGGGLVSLTPASCPPFPPGTQGGNSGRRSHRHPKRRVTLVSTEELGDIAHPLVEHLPGGGRGAVGRRPLVAI